MKATESALVKTLLTAASKAVWQEELLSSKTGQSYNIFEILGLSANELSHSLIIAQLLDPNGSHGQGPIFLKAFLETLDESKLLSTEKTEFTCKESVYDNLDKAIVTTEFHIGAKTADSGGRIDILIRCENHIFVIENKIFAGLQESQLKRYLDFANGEPVFYLTLEGANDTESNDSIPKEDNLFCISYAQDIISWLDRCAHLAISLPHIRETISQYRTLIQKLTKCGNRNMMTQELTNLILENREMYRAFEALKNCDQYLFEELDKKLFSIGESIAKQLGIKHNSAPIQRHRKYCGLGFGKDEWQHLNLNVSIQFSGTYYNDLFFGVCYTKENKASPKNELALRINDRFAETFGNSGSPESWWAAFQHYPDTWRYWRQETYEDILFSSPEEGVLGEFGQDLLTKIKAMSELVDEVIKNPALSNE